MWGFLTFDVWKNMLTWLHFDDKHSEDPWKNAIHLGMYHQRQSTLPRVLFTTLQTNRPVLPLSIILSLLFCLSLLVREHTTPGVIVFVQTSADFLLCLGHIEESGEKTTKRKKQ